MKRILIALLILLGSFISYSQPINSLINELDIPTPQAASYGKFGEIPVDHHTGIPQVSIPIYNVVEGRLSVPIELRYHAGGLKVSEIPEWVGAGWNLNTGGIVSRVVQGRADDGVSGFYHNGSSLNTASTLHQSQVMRGERDGESDIYSYSIPGYSGKFFFEFVGTTPVVRHMPKQDVKIEVTEFLGSLEFRQFTIIDPSGTRYIFGYYNDNGSVTNARESVLAEVEDATRHISSWLLVRVETYDRLFHIDFEYAADDFDYDHPHTCSIIETGLPPECQSGSPPGVCPISTIVIDNQGYALDKITTSNEVIDFTGDHTGLSEIKITTGSFCKTWTFSYDNSIFGDRLTLKTLQQAGCTGPSIPAYTFTYSPSPTVSRFSNMIDHWGYYNGQAANDNIPNTAINIPPTIVEGSAKGQSNRDTDSTSIMSGVLTTITYPTGGSTSFVYEANEIKSTVLSAPSNVVSLQTNEPVNYNCQDVLSDSGQYNFSTQSEVDNSTIDFGLTPDQCITPDENEFFISISLDKWISSAWSPVGYVEYITEDTLPTSLENVPFTDLDTTGSNPTPGLYRFTLKTETSEGFFDLYSQTSSLDNVDVGGLRVKKITTYDGMDSIRNMVKEYSYENPNDPPYSSAKLLRMPLYGALVSGLLVRPGNSTALHEFKLFREDNIIPLSTLEGYHLFYTNVEEIINGDAQGRIKYSFEEEATSLSGDFPIEPGDLAVKRGKLKKSEAVSSTSTIIHSTDITPVNPSYLNGSNFIKPFVAHTYSDCTPAGIYYVGAFNEYNLRTAAYQISEHIEMLDGVTTETTYGYDTANRFIARTRSSITNSDDSTYHTIYTYPHDVAGTPFDSMESLNMILPVITTQKVGPDPITASIIDEYKTTYSLEVTNNGSFPYPFQYFRDEITWDGAGTPSVLDDVLQATVNSYDGATGYPSSITIDGWSPITFNWNSNGTLTSKTFLNFITSYSYHSNTKLLNVVTNVDNTSTAFTYDQLFRLKTTNEQCKNVMTTYDYLYGTPSVGGNQIITTIDHPNVNVRSQLDTIKNIQFFDGLGRPIQQIRKNQGPLPNDDIVKAIEYDNLGRVIHEYEPKIIINEAFQTYPQLASQAKSTNTYEDNPLNRLSQSTHSAFNHPVQTLYGTNTSTINGILASNLFKTTTIDGDGRQSIVYTDKKGRTVATQQAGPGGTSPLTTEYDYDDKDRQTEIIPPGSAAGNPNLNFSNEYYGNDLVKLKKLPDQDQIEYRYNNRDLLIHYQDGHLRGQPSLQWMAYNYDDYGRQTWSGFVINPVANNAALNPSIALNDRLTQTFYYTSGNHIDKRYAHYSWILLPDGSIDPNYFINTNYSGYDNCGRLNWIRKNSLLINDFTKGDVHIYTYDGADNITNDVSYQYENASLKNDINNHTNIDHAGRPSLHEHEFVHHGNDQGDIHIDSTTYNQWDLPDRVLLGHVNGISFLQSMDYHYLNNSWLSAINHFSLGGGDLFYQELFYDNPTVGSGGSIQQNGNIAQINHKVFGANTMITGYTYDNYNRLISSTTHDWVSAALTNGDRYNTTHGYDERGNLISTTRKGAHANGSNFVYNQVDVLNITPQPGTNKISTVADNADPMYKRFGAKGSGNIFEYDNDGSNAGNGNMTYDPTKGARIIYNHMNLPRKIDFDNGGTIEFTYDADGNQLRKVVKLGVETLEDRHYIGDAEYKDGELVQVMHPHGRVARSEPCDQNQFIGGILNNDQDFEGDHIFSNSSVVPTGTTVFSADQSITLTTDFTVESNKIYTAQIVPCNSGVWQYEYVIKDHLGNNRVVFKEDGPDVGSEPDILAENHYYPFGMSIAGPWENRKKQDFNYRYNYKEIHQDFDWDWYNYGARFYDPSIGRFTGVDPLGDQFPHLNMYNYAGNNPITNIDPDGRMFIPFKENCPDCPSPGDLLGRISNVVRNFFDNIGASFIREEGNSVSTATATANQIGEGLEDVVEVQASAIPYGSLLKAAGTGIYDQGDIAADLILSSLGGGMMKGPLKGLIKSVDDLIEAAGKFSRGKTKIGENTIHQNINDVFNTITEGGKVLESGAVKMGDGRIIHKHVSKETGHKTITVNQKGKRLKKIRFIDQ